MATLLVETKYSSRLQFISFILSSKLRINCSDQLNRSLLLLSVESDVREKKNADEILILQQYNHLGH